MLRVVTRGMWILKHMLEHAAMDVNYARKEIKKKVLTNRVVDEGNKLDMQLIRTQVRGLK